MSNDIFYEKLLSTPIYLIPETPAELFDTNAKSGNGVLAVVSRLPLTLAEDELLRKILQAAKINPAQTDKISIADYNRVNNSRYNYILFFVGVRQLPPELAVFGLYSDAPAYEQAHVIIANDLTQLADDVEGKKQLWQLLKQIFLS